MSERNFTWVGVGSRGVKAWDKAGIDGKTWAQLCQTAKLPFIHRYVAAMPDAHFGLGSTVGSVIPTLGAIVPASVGVDIGCGMMACRTRYCADQLPDSLKGLRDRIERAVPHGRSNRGGPGDRGAWGEPPKHVDAAFLDLKDGMEAVTSRTPVLKRIEHKTVSSSGRSAAATTLSRSALTKTMMYGQCSIADPAIPAMPSASISRAWRRSI